MATIEHIDDNVYTITFEETESRHSSITVTIALPAEEFLKLAGDLDVWRWRITGDSYDPISAARIQDEARERLVTAIVTGEV